MTSVHQAAQTERRAMWRWTSIIVGMLLLQVVLCAIGVTAALRGKGVMVEADYYNKALHWDDQAALVRASNELGWKTELSVGATATTGGDRALLLRLVDKAGAPIENAMVSVAFFHHARPLELRQAELKSAGGGLYVSSVPLDRKGIWEFRLTIHRVVTGAKDEMYVATLQRDLLE